MGEIIARNMMSWLILLIKLLLHLVGSYIIVRSSCWGVNFVSSWWIVWPWPRKFKRNYFVLQVLAAKLKLTDHTVGNPVP